MKLANRWCAKCRKQGPAVYAAPNHVLHLLITLLTCGWWMIVWIWVAFFGGAYQCRDCGSRTYPSRMFAPLMGGARVAALLLLAGLGYLLFSAIGRNETKTVGRKEESARTQLPVSVPDETQASNAVDATLPARAIDQPADADRNDPASATDAPLGERADPVSEALPAVASETKTDPGVADQAREVRARSKYEMGKALFLKDRDGAGRKRLQEVIDQFPGTKAADEAAKLLKR